MNIVNNYAVTIFKSDNGKYTVGMSNKKQDGSYENAYYPIQFNKDVELENKTRIYIKNAWLSFYKWQHEDKKGTTFFIRCSQFELADTQEEPKQEGMDPYKFFGDSITVKQIDDINDDSLPF